MKINCRIFPILISLSALITVSSCEEETSDQPVIDQEQRFFDLYIGSNYPDVDSLSSGLYFLENTVGEGILPDTNDWVLVNHVCYMIPEDLVYESYMKNVSDDNRLDIYGAALYGPYKMQNGSRNKGLTEGLSLMREGGEATIFFTSDLGYGSFGSGKFGPTLSVPAYKSLKYEVELLEVIKDMDAYEQAKIDAYIDTITHADTIHDPETDAIMYYMIDLATDNAPVAVDSTIVLAYKGYLTDGRVFDEKTEDDPYTYTVTAEGGVHILGWELGMLRLKEGEKARFVIPYQLAYGETEQLDPTYNLRTIPPYETLVFDIEILSVTGVVEEDPDTEPEL